MLLKILRHNLVVTRLEYVAVVWFVCCEIVFVAVFLVVWIEMLMAKRTEPTKGIGPQGNPFFSRAAFGEVLLCAGGAVVDSNDKFPDISC
jgi:hypothetical protein